MKLTYKDIETILGIENNILHECNDNSQLVIEAYPKGEDYYGEILRRFNNQRIKSQRIISAEAKEALYDKLAWSREDEQNLNAAFSYINDDSLCRWLKDVIHVKYDKPAWSEEDTSLCIRIQGILSVCESNSLLSPDLCKEMCDWLKSLKQRIGG